MRIKLINVLVHYVYNLIPLPSSWNDFNTELQMPSTMLQSCFSVLWKCSSKVLFETAEHLRWVARPHISKIPHNFCLVKYSEISRMPAARFEQQTSFSQSDIHWQILKATTASSNHEGRTRRRLVASAPDQMCAVISPANLSEFVIFTWTHFHPFPQIWYGSVMLCGIGLTASEIMTLRAGAKITAQVIISTRTSLPPWKWQSPTPTLRATRCTSGLCQIGKRCQRRSDFKCG